MSQVILDIVIRRVKTCQAIWPIQECKDVSGDVANSIRTCEDVSSDLANSIRKCEDVSGHVGHCNQKCE
eukprot:2452616-Pyramimonas_sp.AAC.1